jgi:hypothetical protein
LLTRTRVEISDTEASGPNSNRAAIGAGFWSITSVIASTRLMSPGGSVARNVTGTMAASSARYGISIAITPAPSFIARLLKMSWTRPGHGS